MSRIAAQLCLGLLLVAGTSFASSHHFEPPHLQLPMPTSTGTSAKVITLKDAVLLALRNNSGIRTAELNRVTQKFALLVARNGFEPQYSLQSKAGYVEGQGPTYGVTPSVSLTTPLGTQLSIGLNSTFGQGGDSSVANFSLKQPLLKGFGPLVTLEPLRAAIEAEMKARLGFKSTVISTIDTVIKDYYALAQAYSTLEIDQRSLESSKETLYQIRKKIQVGQKAPNDAVQQEAQVASSRFRITADKALIESAMRALLSDLDFSPMASIKIDRSIYLQRVFIPNEKKSIRLAMANNIDYQTSLIDYRASQRNVLLAEDQQRWTLDLTANASATISKTGDAAVTDAADLNSTATGRSIGLSLDIPIDDKSNQQTLLNAKIGLQTARIALEDKRRALVTSVINGITALRSSAQQIIEGERTVKLDKMALDAALIKLKFGRVTIFEVTQLRDTLRSDANTLVQSKINYINSLSGFYQTLGITLKVWGIRLHY